MFLNKLTTYTSLISLLLTLNSCSFFKKDFCKDEAVEQPDKACPNVSLNAYIENSGSIDGYVSSGTSFKTGIYTLLTNEHVKAPKLSYVNDSIYRQSCDARNFILKLTPSTFKQQGGNRAFSDISEVIERVLGDSPKEVALLASDFIFSPPTDAQSVKEYLSMQQQDISNTMGRRFKQDSHFCVVILQGISDYAGYYWNVSNTKSTYHGKRPYYVMLAGNRSAIALLLHSAMKGDTHFINSFTEAGLSPMRYEVVKNTSAKYGTFKLCKKSKNGLRHHLKDCHANKRSGNFTFKVYVDYSCLPLTDQYLCDASNYATSTSSYKVTSVAPLNASADGYTHCITLTANDSKHLCASSCDILLKKLFPAWIEQCNDAEGTAPLPGKTFGLLPLMRGVQKAFSSTDACYARMRFCIE